MMTVGRTSRCLLWVRHVLVHEVIAWPWVSPTSLWLLVSCSRKNSVVALRE
jgi:hypothetical protein